jgi:hypothetical protein
VLGRTEIPLVAGAESSERARDLAILQSSAAIPIIVTKVEWEPNNSHLYRSFNFVAYL